MEHLNSQVELKAGDVVQVTLDNQANVMLMDPSNYAAYRSGQAYRYFGGHATETPVKLTAPHAGRWHVVVDLGGYAGTVRAGVSVIPGMASVR